MLCLIGAVLLSGCAQQATVKGAWQDGVPRKQSFTRVLVVGVTPHVNQRCQFEAFMASQLKSESVQAIRSCDAVTQKNPLTLESIEQAVASVQADAVLATSLVSREYEAKEGGSRDTRGSAMYKATDAGYATGYYGVYGVPVIYGGSSYGGHHYPGRESHLIEVLKRGKTLIYTLIRTPGTSSRRTPRFDVAAAIAVNCCDGLTHWSPIIRMELAAGDRIGEMISTDQSGVPKRAFSDRCLPLHAAQCGRNRSTTVMGRTQSSETQVRILRPAKPSQGGLANDAGFGIAGPYNPPPMHAFGASKQ
jgi:hypothetical protein